MARLWIANLPPEAGDDEIDEFLQKYGFPPCDTIKRVPGESARPAAVVSYPDLNEDMLGRMTPRVNDLAWRERKLFVNVLPPERE